MCFCRRKTSSKEDVDSSKKVESSKRNGRNQPVPPVPIGDQIPVPTAAKPDGKSEQKVRQGKSFPRAKKSRKNRQSDEDTVSNIPDEMPDLEINRDHPEPFYTDEQLM